MVIATDWLHWSANSDCPLGCCSEAAQVYPPGFCLAFTLGVLEALSVAWAG
jgi:hypothetical protein